MIDTHAHIDDPQYSESLPVFLDEQKAGGVEAIVIPGINTDSIASIRKVVSLDPRFCFPAFGLHPEEVKDDYLEQLGIIESALREGDCVAVGEIGLDYYWDVTYKTQQKHALEAQLELALQLDLPVLLHNRDSTEDLLQMLLPFAKRGLRGVMHCFTGSRETAARILDMGLYLGIGGVLTFKNTRLTETLAYLPLERIVLETDSPYMAPVPFRGKRNEPRFISYVIERMAQVYGLTHDEIDRQTTANARHLLTI